MTTADPIEPIDPTSPEYVAIVPIDADGFPLTYQTEDDVGTTATANGKPAAKSKPKPKKGKEKPKRLARGTKPKVAPKERTFGGGPAVPELPAGEEMDLDLKSLWFDRRMQSRVTLIDEETVEKYKSWYQDDPNFLPRLTVVDIGQADADERHTLRYVVVDGFQRGESLKRAKFTTARCRVIPGTWDFAIRLSMSANSGHGLTRTSADIRKAFQRFLDHEEIRDGVLQEWSGKGGANRAISAVLGISKGMVTTLLHAMGLTTRGDKIVPKPRPENEPTRHERSEGDPSPALRVESKEAIKSRATAALIKEMVFSAAALQRRYEELLDRDDVSPLFKEVVSRYGIPVVRTENTTQAPGEPASIEVTEFWGAVDTVLRSLEILQEQFSNMNCGDAA